MNTAKRIFVLLADDHLIVLEGLKLLLKAESDLEVVGEAANGHQAVALTRKLRPDVVIMDIAMPQLNGLEAARQIRKAVPDTKVIILSAHSDDLYVEQATNLGAAGYLIKQTASRFLSEAIRKVHRGETYFSPALSKRFKLLQQEPFDQKNLTQVKAARLSSRQLEVLQLIAESIANKQIAESLDISVKTVEKHRDHLMQKLDIHDIAGLTRYAVSTGLIGNRVPLTLT